MSGVGGNLKITVNDNISCIQVLEKMATGKMKMFLMAYKPS